MKYIIDVPDNTKQIDAMYLWHVLKSYPLSELEPYIEPDCKAIEDEVWKFVNFLENKLMASDYDDIFDDNSPYDHMSYQEAKTKYEAWLKQKDEIHVGDEIVGIYSDGKKTPPLVVLKVEGNYYFGIYSKTGEFVQGGLNYEKTGRHFNEVAELLKKMRGVE